MITGSDAIDTQIPYYLTENQKHGLKKAMKDFRDAAPIDYYLDGYPNEMLQGDGWQGLELVQFESGARASVRGIVLSNTCDVSADNKRDLPTRIVFAPIVRLSRYEELLEKASLSPDQIEGKLQAIRSQAVTTLFYLPPGRSLEAEYVAILDDVHTLPSSAFESNKESRKLFTLSMIGFYLFVFKLSIHFCRFHEEVTR